MQKPLISIVMSTYDNSPYLREAIESVLVQSFTNWEFIIINDASTDNTDEILKEYKIQDDRIIYIKNSKNEGQTKNLNKGIDLAKGDFIARLDGDDIWIDKSKLQQQIDFLLNNPTYGLVGGLGYAVDIENRKIFTIIYPSENNQLRKIMLKHGPFIHSSILMRKSILAQIGKYNTKHFYSQDYDLYLNMGTQSKLHNIPTFMVHYRINPKGISGTKYWEQHNEIIKIIKKYRNYYPDYFSGFILWNLRKFYPVWFRGSVSRDLKKKIPFLYKISGA